MGYTIVRYHTLSYYFDIADFRNEFLRIDRLKAKDPEPFSPGPRY